jgi:hypothetical protein
MSGWEGFSELVRTALERDGEGSLVMENIAS